MNARCYGSWKTQVSKKAAVLPSTSNQSMNTDIAFLSLQLQTCRHIHLPPENWKAKN